VDLPRLLTFFVGSTCPWQMAEAHIPTRGNILFKNPTAVFFLYDSMCVSYSYPYYSFVLFSMSMELDWNLSLCLCTSCQLAAC
jgi:hypothetical protein